MPDIELPIIESGTPAGLCYTTLTNDIPIIAQYLRAVYSGNEVNTGSSTPAAEDRGKPWLRTNSDGTDDGMWVFYNGFWIQKHEMPVGAVILYEGSLASIPTFDGGESASITNITGPFWEEVTAMQARSPMHPGTLSSGAVVNVGDNIGEEKHVQVLAELIQHNHKVLSSKDGSLSGDSAQILNAPESSLADQGKTTENTGGNPPDGMNVIHPCRGIFSIRRSARLYRRRAA